MSASPRQLRSSQAAPGVTTPSRRRLGRTVGSAGLAAPLLAVLAALLLAACGAGGGHASSDQLSAADSQQLVNAEQAIANYCHTKRRDTSVSQAIAELISLARSRPTAHMSFPGTPGPFPSVRSVVRTERQQLANCGASAYAQTLANTLARHR